MNISSYNLGKWGEQKAKDYLVNSGYNILEENYRIKTGEIDLIGCHHDFVIFFEVKTRSSTNYGLPQTAVDVRKKKKIRKIASHFLVVYKKNFFVNYKKRFDVIAITINKGKAELKHFKNAF